LRESATATVASLEYTVISDECMQLKAPEIPSIEYGTVTTPGAFGASCKAAKDCTSTLKGHGCMTVS
jgi:hypothetical protein